MRYESAQNWVSVKPALLEDSLLVKLIIFSVILKITSSVKLNR